MAIPTITTAQTDALSPINETLMEGLRQRSTYTPIGTILPWYDYNGLLDTPEGFMVCNGQVISEANYDAETGRSAGDWDLEIGSSVLAGKYTPNLASKYLQGGSSTQAGTGAITSVGNTGNTISTQHNHAWLKTTLTLGDLSTKTYGSSGSELTIIAESHTTDGDCFAGIDSGTNGMAVGRSSSSGNGNTYYYTDNDGSTSQSIAPESIVCKFIIRII